MRRHQYFVYYLIPFILISNQWIKAEDLRQVDPRPFLSQWSAASQHLASIAPLSKVKKFKKENQKYFSGHELTLFTEFQQPVTTESLLTHYDWQLVKSTKKQIILRGQPKDKLTRHFCRPFELQINPQSMLPESLTFVSKDSKQQTSSFASIEFTALKLTEPPKMDLSKSNPQTVLRKVAKVVFPQEERERQFTSSESPIKRISFTTLNSDPENQAELLEIEQLVSRWVAESERIELIRLSNSATILKPENHSDSDAPRELFQKSDEPNAHLNSPYQRSLQPWLINVDRDHFVIESFTIESSTNKKNKKAPRFITLIIKPNPVRPKQHWDRVEIKFNSEQPLPVKISEIRGDYAYEFLLTGKKVQYLK